MVYAGHNGLRNDQEFSPNSKKQVKVFRDYNDVMEWTTSAQDQPQDITA